MADNPIPQNKNFYIERIFLKLTSVRVLVTLIMVTAYCGICFRFMDMAMLGIVSVDFIQGFITGGIGSLVLMIVKDYFGRDDRSTKPSGDAEGK
jgi:hypothetical protein